MLVIVTYPRGVSMYLYLLELGENGPWACNMKAIENAIDHLGVVPFGVWLIETDKDQSLYFGTMPTCCASPQLLTSYQAIREVVWEKYADFGYEELNFTFGFSGGPDQSPETYQWGISPREEFVAIREAAREGGLRERPIRIRI